MDQRKAARKWRHLVDGYRLYFDQVRVAMAHAAHHIGGSGTEPCAFWESIGFEIAPGGQGSKFTGPAPLPGESLVDAFQRLCVTGTITDRTVFAEWAAVIAAYLGELLIVSPRTRLFVADADLVTDVVGSRNEPLAGEDLDRLPFPLTWVEFDDLVPIADGFTRRLEAQAVGFWTDPVSPLRLAMVVSGVMCRMGSGRMVTNGVQHLRANASLYLLYWGNDLIFDSADEELAVHLGFNPVGRDPAWTATTRQASVAARNVYEFLTSRSFDYVTCERPPRDLSVIKRFRHLQGGAAQGLRHYRMVRVNKEVVEPGRARVLTEAVGTATATEMPGAFHRWVYCRACAGSGKEPAPHSLHRHDLVGAPCRRCGATVGPTANVRVERYWHPPYMRGSGVVKEYVRHMVGA